MEYQSIKFDEDIELLKKHQYISHLEASLEALISYLKFKVKYIYRTGKRPSPTLNEMQMNPRKHVLSFISSMHQGIRYFGILHSG